MQRRKCFLAYVPPQCPKCRHYYCNNYHSVDYIFPIYLYENILTLNSPLENNFCLFLGATSYFYNLFNNFFFTHCY